MKKFDFAICYNKKEDSYEIWIRWCDGKWGLNMSTKCKGKDNEYIHYSFLEKFVKLIENESFTFIGWMRREYLEDD